jgi:predicted  nucleic acid-binding Zn-ribbon protein
MAPKAQQTKRTAGTIIRELVDRTNTDTARIRVLEQEKETLKSRMESVEESAASSRKQTEKLVADLSSRLDRHEKRAAEMESTIKEIIREMKKLASVSKIRELEALVEIYNPIKSQFITREEAEQLIESKSKSSS